MFYICIDRISIDVIVVWCIVGVVDVICSLGGCSLAAIYRWLWVIALWWVTAHAGD